VPAQPPHGWRPGDHLTHRFNTDLGIGRVVEADPRAVLVEFPKVRTRLRLAADTDALSLLHLQPGHPVRVNDSRAETTVASLLPDGRVALANGLVVSPDELWPLDLDGALAERLRLGHLDEPQDFVVRLGAMRLRSLREENTLGSFLGGRVRLFPHQLHVAEQATRTDPVRWLLADEVGLGKTVEACLILNHLVHTGRVQRCLIVVPESLTVQWLGELWRKYHQVFTVLDGPRLADVEKDFGQDANPFEIHPRAVIAIETLVAHPELTTAAVRASIDLLVVDEAQRLRRPPGHPGEPAWRAVAPIAALGRHVLLLSATPLEDDAHGFFRLLQLLRPDVLPETVPFETMVSRSTGPAPAFSSSTRRSDIGGLPPRVAIPIDLDGPDWNPMLRVEQILRRTPPAHEIARRRMIDRIRRGQASGAALRAVLGPDEQELRQLAEQMDRRDGRLTWLASQAPRWKTSGEKTLVFVAHRETLEMVRDALGRLAQTATGMFHEDLPASRRDIEVARFREAEGPSILVSTEAGGEGRNFEFCRRLVLFDLPWEPPAIEQRIGRLDRIGRRLPVDVVYFRPPDGIGRDIVNVFEALRLFSQPVAGMEPQMRMVTDALERLATQSFGTPPTDTPAALARTVFTTRSAVQTEAYRQLHRAPYTKDMGPGILERVPAHIDELTEGVIVSACVRLGFGVERIRGARCYAIELGTESLVDSLPGVPGGTSFVGTFDREEAVTRETLDFFASGHALVEAVLAHLEDSPGGRAVCFEMQAGREAAEGIVAAYRTPNGFELVAVDASGRRRPDWVSVLQRWPPKLTPVSGRSRQQLPMERLLALVNAGRRPEALAAVIVKPQRG